MKILHFKPTMNLEEGGVVKAVLDLCAMSQTSDQVGIATFDPQGLPEEWCNDPDSNTPPEVGTAKLHQLKGHSTSGQKINSQHKAQLESIIKNYDIVHLHSMWNVSNPQVAQICKKLNIPYILSTHGMLDDWCMSQRKLKKVLYLKTWARNLLPDAAAIHTTAQAELDQSCAWFDRSQGSVVPLPFDLSEYQDVPPATLAYESFPELNPELPKIIFLSRIHYKKGVDRLIKASAIMNAKGVKHQLVIAGTGDQPYVQEMKALAQKEGVTDHTYFLGFATGPAKVALLGACEVFALPTSQENFGFVFFEALAAGTMVVTTKGTDTWPEIQSSNGGVIVDNTPQAFAAALEQVLADPQAIQNRSQEARAWVFENLAMSEIQRQFKELYESTAHKNKGDQP
ncbi:MAG: glycosyltransferase [Phycisphaerales bacterium]